MSKQGRWLNRLRHRCLSPIESFKAHGKTVRTKRGIHVFQDNGSQVLAVAHLDTVQKTNHFFQDDKDTVCCGQLDDRLGVFLLLDVLPAMGIEYDLLLTEGEESGMTTAVNFKPPKEYNWMFSFDRCGDDVVLYQYETDDLLTKLEKAGFLTGIGSYSDISDMGHLKCAGFNFGCGYHNCHSENAWFSIQECLSQVNLFRAFWEKYHDTRFRHSKRMERRRWPWSWKSSYESTTNWWDNPRHWDDESLDMRLENP